MRISSRKNSTEQSSDKMTRHSGASFFVPQRILCYHHVMRFRKILIGLFLLLSLPLFADYSILLPDRNRYDFIVASEDGDTIALDDNVWYKRWNGLLLENMAPSIYMITENDDSTLIVGRKAAIEDIRSVIRLNSIDIIITEKLLSEKVIEDFDGDEIVTTERFDKLYEIMLEKNDISASTVKRGDRINISDGEYVPHRSEKEILVSCPHCGHTFRIYI